MAETDAETLERLREEHTLYKNERGIIFSVQHRETMRLIETLARRINVTACALVTAETVIKELLAEVHNGHRRKQGCLKQIEEALRAADLSKEL